MSAFSQVGIISEGLTLLPPSEFVTDHLNNSIGQ